MIWEDKIGKKCRSAEDFNFMFTERLRKKELKHAVKNPVTIVSGYERSIPFVQYKTFGRFACFGFGCATTKGKGGWRYVIFNSIN